MMLIGSPTLAEKKMLFLSLVALFGVWLSAVVLDQTSKIQSERQLLVDSVPGNIKAYKSRSIEILRIGEASPFKPGVYFGLTYVRNPGSAWGAFQDLNDKFRIPFFYGVTIIAIIICLIYLRSTPAGHRLARFAFVLFLAGAVGNVLDRLRVGFVIDWIDVKWNLFGWYYDFPVFNIADSCLSVGIVLILLDAVIEAHERRKLNLAKKAAQIQNM